MAGTVGFNPNASFLHLTDRFTRKVRRKIRGRKKRLGNLEGLFGTKNFIRTQPISYKAADAILKQEGTEAITLFFWFQGSAGELVVYGPASNQGEIAKAYQYIHDIRERKDRQRKRQQKLWGATGTVGKVVMIATLIGVIATLIGVVVTVYLALARQ